MCKKEVMHFKWYSIVDKEEKKNLSINFIEKYTNTFIWKWKWPRSLQFSSYSQEFLVAEAVLTWRMKGGGREVTMRSFSAWVCNIVYTADRVSRMRPRKINSIILNSNKDNRWPFKTNDSDNMIFYHNASWTYLLKIDTTIIELVKNCLILLKIRWTN